MKISESPLLAAVWCFTHQHELSANAKQEKTKQEKITVFKIYSSLVIRPGTGSRLDFWRVGLFAKEFPKLLTLCAAGVWTTVTKVVCVDHFFYGVLFLAKNILASVISSIYHWIKKMSHFPPKERGRIEREGRCARSYRVAKILFCQRCFFSQDPSGFKLQIPHQPHVKTLETWVYKIIWIWWMCTCFL